MAVAKRVLKRLYRTKATRTHKAYQRYVKRETVKKRKPMSFRIWSETKGTYFGGPGKGLGRAKLRRKK